VGWVWGVGGWGTRRVCPSLLLGDRQVGLGEPTTGWVPKKYCDPKVGGWVVTWVLLARQLWWGLRALAGLNPVPFVREREPRRCDWMCVDTAQKT
jgi:hypothetical protein